MDKKTKNLLLLAGAGAAVYYFFFHKKKEAATSSFSRVVGNGDKDDADGCWTVSKYMGQYTDPVWESPCPHTQASSFSNASGKGCWVTFVDPDTGGSTTSYREPCPVSLPADPMSKGGGKGGKKARRTRFGTGQSF